MERFVCSKRERLTLRLGQEAQTELVLAEVEARLRDVASLEAWFNELHRHLGASRKTREAVTARLAAEKAETERRLAAEAAKRTADEKAAAEAMNNSASRETKLPSIECH